jgi:RNA ligase (TIGR02306 family)
MERKLAHIETILKLEPIPGADLIEKATILGWSVVVRKDEFKVGDKCIYVEIDSILPERSEFEFLRLVHFRIKTTKRKGCISQGICFPLSILAEKYFPLCEQFGSPLPEGTDVTEILGIQKWEPYVPAQLAGEVKGSFPDFLFKSDETRIQAVPELLEKHQGKKFYVSEKCDGSSMSVFLNNGVFGVCSRNLELRETEGNSFWKVARELNLESKLMGEVNKLPLNVALQGELVGPGVQGNKYKLDKLTFLVFNVFDINRRRHLDYNDFKDVVYGLGLTPVPMVSEDFLLPQMMDEMVEFSKGKSLLNKDVHREGIVLRPLVNEYDEDLRGRLSFKVINPNFLLKYDSD